MINSANSVTIWLVEWVHLRESAQLEVWDRPRICAYMHCTFLIPNFVSYQEKEILQNS